MGFAPSYGRCDGHQNPHVGFGPDAVRFADIRYQDIPCRSRHGLVVFAQKRPLPFEHRDGKLSLDIMGMHGKLLAAFEIEVDHLEIR